MIAKGRVKLRKNEGLFGGGSPQNDDCMLESHLQFGSLNRVVV